MDGLPQPSEAFEWVQAAGGPALVCRPLLAVAPHLFTSRHWAPGRAGTGASGADGAGDNTAWHDVAAALGVPPGSLARLVQVHGARAVTAAAALRGRESADVVVTDNPDLGLAIQAADCVPLLIADRQSGAVAAAHAGWRGLAIRVPARAVAALAEAFNARAAELVAAVGPSIGACCYEVGTDVRDQFMAGGWPPEQLSRWFLDRPRTDPANPSLPQIKPDGRPNHWFFDGWAAARAQLEAAGIPREQIHVAALCTASHPSALCSYRRDGAPAGRLAGAIRTRPRP